MFLAVFLAMMGSEPVVGQSVTSDSTLGLDEMRANVSSPFGLSSAASDSQAAADDSTKKPTRTIGSAFFGGPSDPPVFGVAPAVPGKESAKWPNISEPGPDMGDFPNSAFTLPKGRCYIEIAPVTLSKADSQNPDSLAVPFLFRYGLTDDVEFRVLGNGLTSVGGAVPTTGLSPLNFDLKVHLWDDRKEWLIPAASLEVLLLTKTGSPQFNAGVEPSLNMNFDLPITEKLNLEWTVGYTGVQEAVNINTNERFVPRFNYLVPGIHHQFDLSFQQFSASWAVEYEVNDRLEVFVHGLHNGAILRSFGSGEVIGAGLFWKFSDRLMGFGSLNFGLTKTMPPIDGQLGIAFAL